MTWAVLLKCKSYIEEKFEPGMSWDNWGMDTWHLDHIRPLTDFDLTDREQFLQACHYTNYQPLSAQDNRVKNRFLDWTPSSGILPEVDPVL